MQDPDFPIKLSGTSLGAKEKATVVLNPFERANKAIWTNTIIPNKFPYNLNKFKSIFKLEWFIYLKFEEFLFQKC